MSEETPLIRLAEPADHPSVLVLWGALMAEHGELDPRLTVAPQGHDYAKALLLDRGNQDKHLLVAEVDGAIVGFVFGLLVDNLPVYQPDLLGYITDCFVTPAYRSRGIGARLVDALLDWFRQRGVLEVEVSAATRNPRAISFWRRSGAVDKLLRLSYQI